MLTIDFRKLQIKRGMRVLDAGCGAGRHLCEAYKNYGADVVGVDLNWDDLCKTRSMLHLVKREDTGNWITARADVTALPFASECFDVVICSEVLEHVPDNVGAVEELVRVLKPGGDIVVSVPRYLPERICWVLSEAYHNEPGGHIRIYKRNEIKGLLEDAGTRCWSIRYKHSLHSPYWWLKCAVGHKNDEFPLVKAYRRFLEWDIIKGPPFTKALDKMLNPLIAKSVVLYLKKGY
ncbi:MAG: methyltransferase domain-containing protein [Smithellaceae bacterium]|nr:methyltransferase domain-containing protein [Smithellaceae bacterium]